MDSGRRLTDEFVVRDYDSEEDRARRERIRHAERPASLNEPVESASRSPNSLDQDEDEVGGVGNTAVAFVRSNTRAVTAGAVGLALLAIEAWRRGRRSPT